MCSAPPRPGLQRVLVLSGSAGAGHVRAAQTIERALVATGRVREVRHVDILQYTSKLFRRVYAQTSSTARRRSSAGSTTTSTSRGGTSGSASR